MRTLHQRFSAGLLVRVLAYEFKGTGYFSPDRFTVLEGRGRYTFSNRRWSARITAGLGIQQVGQGASVQSEWHLEARGGRAWGPGRVIEVYAGISNSAESSTTGGLRWRTAGLVVRLGL